MNLPLSFLAQAAAPNTAMGPLDMILFFVAVIGVIAFGIWQGNKETKGAAESGGAAGYFLGWTRSHVVAGRVSRSSPPTFPPNNSSGCPGRPPTGLAWRSHPTNGWRRSPWWWWRLSSCQNCFAAASTPFPSFWNTAIGVVSRTVMAISTLIILVGVPTASVIYSGAKVVSVFFAGQVCSDLDLGSITVGCWIIGLSAAVYVFVGGLKACAWTDLIWGAALIAGGAVVIWLALGAMEDADPNDLIATKVANSSATVQDLRKSQWLGTLHPAQRRQGRRGRRA